MNNMNKINGVTFKKTFWEKIKNKSEKNIHIIIIGTKPDIIKQAPLVLELQKRKKLILLGHTGQHYDAKLNEDARKVFGITPDFNINAQGSLHQKIGQIISRFGNILFNLKKTNKNIIPYVHGDTTTAAASAIAAFMNQIAPVHVEAGLRSYNPQKKIFTSSLKKFNFDNYYKNLIDKKNWTKGSIEPYPEQFDTRVVGATAGLHNAPTQINKENLIQEGYSENKIFVVGNSVSDSLKIATSKGSNIFKKYPQLKNGFIRFAIHRRENVGSYHRFTTIFEVMEELVKNKKIVLWLSHNVNKQAIKDFRLEERLKMLIKKYPNFLYSDTLWDYDDNIAALSVANLNVTDSGSEQEETNLLKVPSVTVRFGSDRPETIWAGGNIIAPPISKNFLLRVIEGAESNSMLKKSPKLYGSNVSEKIINKVENILERDGTLFQWEHEKYGFHKLKFWRN